MSATFDPNARLVLIPVYLGGPAGGSVFQFALDTGCTRTAVSGLVLERLGYRADQAVGRHHVRTGTSGVHAARIRLSAIVALDQARTNAEVLWLPLPPGTLIEGLLGLDFFRGQRLSIDFQRGRIDLGPRRPWWRVWR